MSGHSKFANIKHKKERNDAAKGKIFTIIGREIAIAVKEGGADPNNNSKLRDVIAKAKASNMPNDTIERGIKKAAGNQDAVNYEQVTYEGYGPNGIAIIVDALTDNRNRTSADVRAAFSKGQGNVGTPGCVSFMFDKKGQIIIDKEECDMDSDDLMMEVLDCGADDFQEEDDSYVVIASDDAFKGKHGELFHFHGFSGVFFGAEEFRHICRIHGEHVVRDQIFRVVEPERGHPGENSTFVCDLVFQNMVKGGDPVCRDHDQTVADVIYFSYFS